MKHPTITFHDLCLEPNILKLILSHDHSSHSRFAISLLATGDSRVRTALNRPRTELSLQFVTSASLIGSRGIIPIHTILQLYGVVSLRLSGPYVHSLQFVESIGLSLPQLEHLTMDGLDLENALPIYTFFLRTPQVFPLLKTLDFGPNPKIALHRGIFNVELHGRQRISPWPTYTITDMMAEKVFGQNNAAITPRTNLECVLLPNWTFAGLFAAPLCFNPLIEGAPHMTKLDLSILPLLIDVKLVATLPRTLLELCISTRQQTTRNDEELSSILVRYNPQYDRTRNDGNGREMRHALSARMMEVMPPNLQSILVLQHTGCKDPGSTYIYSIMDVVPTFARLVTHLSMSLKMSELSDTKEAYDRILPDLRCKNLTLYELGEFGGHLAGPVPHVESFRLPPTITHLTFMAIQHPTNDMYDVFVEAIRTLPVLETLILKHAFKYGSFERLFGRGDALTPPFKSLKNLTVHVAYFETYAPLVDIMAFMPHNLTTLVLAVTNPGVEPSGVEEEEDISVMLPHLTHMTLTLHWTDTMGVDVSQMDDESASDSDSDSNDEENSSDEWKRSFRYVLSPLISFAFTPERVLPRSLTELRINVASTPFIAKSNVNPNMNLLFLTLLKQYSFVLATINDMHTVTQWRDNPRAPKMRDPDLLFYALPKCADDPQQQDELVYPLSLCHPDVNKRLALPPSLKYLHIGLTPSDCIFFQTDRESPRVALADLYPNLKSLSLRAYYMHYAISSVENEPVCVESNGQNLPARSVGVCPVDLTQRMPSRLERLHIVVGTEFELRVNKSRDSLYDKHKYHYSDVTFDVISSLPNRLKDLQISPIQVMNAGDVSYSGERTFPSNLLCVSRALSRVEHWPAALKSIMLHPIVTYANANDACLAAVSQWDVSSKFTNDDGANQRATPWRKIIMGDSVGENEIDKSIQLIIKLLPKLPKIVIFKVKDHELARALAISQSFNKLKHIVYQ